MKRASDKSVKWDALREVSDHFVYLSDRDQFGKRDCWFIMEERPYRGDCEDFALTVLYQIKGKSVFRMLMSLAVGRSKIHFCTAPDGALHSTLRYDGLYSDNWQRTWLTKQSFIRKGYAFHPIHFLVGNVIIRLIRGKLRG